MAPTKKMPGTADPKLRKLRKSYSDCGTAFFKDSKVHSSSGFMKAGGTILAIPFPTKGFYHKDPVLDGKTEYSRQFTDAPVCYSSMPKKPLCVYDPLAYRSRNMQSCPPKMNKHTSSLTFESGGLHFQKKRRFVTTHSNEYEGMPCDPRTNGGILAEKCALRRFHQAK